MTYKLSLLLGSDSDAAEEVVVFPCENQNMATLKHACHHQHISSIAFFAVIWDNGDQGVFVLGLILKVAWKEIPY